MTRYLYLLLFIWLLLVADGWSAEPGKKDAVARDLAKLQGKWRFIEEDRDGTVTKYKNGFVITIVKELGVTHTLEVANLVS